MKKTIEKKEEEKKSFFEKHYLKIQDRLEIKRTQKIMGGLYLVIIAILILLFDREIGDMSILYILPISYIYFAFIYLYTGNKIDRIKNKNWPILLVASVVLVLVPIYIAFNHIGTKEVFMGYVGLLFVLKSVFDFISYSSRSPFEMISNVAIAAIGLLIVFLKSILVTNYVILITIILIIGILELITSITINNVLDK